MKTKKVIKGITYTGFDQSRGVSFKTTHLSRIVGLQDSLTQRLEQGELRVEQVESYCNVYLIQPLNKLQDKRLWGKGLFKRAQQRQLRQMMQIALCSLWRLCLKELSEHNYRVQEGANIFPLLDRLFAFARPLVNSSFYMKKEVLKLYVNILLSLFTSFNARVEHLSEREYLKLIHALKKLQTLFPNEEVFSAHRGLMEMAYRNDYLSQPTNHSQAWSCAPSFRQVIVALQDVGSPASSRTVAVETKQDEVDLSGWEVVHKAATLPPSLDNDEQVNSVVEDSDYGDDNGFVHVSFQKG